MLQQVEMMLNCSLNIVKVSNCCRIFFFNFFSNSRTVIEFCSIYVEWLSKLSRTVVELLWYWCRIVCRIDELLSNYCRNTVELMPNCCRVYLLWIFLSNCCWWLYTQWNRQNKRKWIYGISIKLERAKNPIINYEYLKKAHKYS